MKNGRRLGAHSPPKPYQPPERPEGKINLSDLDSRNVKTPRGWVQGYNAQAVTTADQIVIAAEVTVASPGLRAPRADGRRRPAPSSTTRASPSSLDVVLADAGYWHQVQMQRLMSRRTAGPRPARRQQAQGRTPGLAGRPLHVHAPRPRNRAGRRALRPAPGHDRARLRPHQVQPPLRPLPRRGRSACRSEWRLINATHNLLKLYKHTTAPRRRLSGRRRRSPGRRTSALRRRSHLTARHARGPAQLRNSHHATEQRSSRQTCRPAR